VSAIGVQVQLNPPGLLRFLPARCRGTFSQVITLPEVLAELRRLQSELAQRHVARIGVFGSMARGEATPQSDIDVLVEMTEEGDLFDLVSVKTLLERTFDQSVDVVPVGGLKQDVRDVILREVRYAA
jgi:predicted nucleotidyltransferase